MKPRLPKFALPSLSLTPEEQQAVISECETVLAETLAHERSFRRGETTPDKKEWKQVKAREGIRIRKERHPNHSSPSDVTAPRFLSLHDDSVSSIDSIDSNEEELDYVTSIKDPRVPMVITTGTVEGTLEDVIFGSMASDEVSWRLRATYMKDKTSDSKILATIIEPTEADPYKCLCIKWFMREIPGYLSPFMHVRDFLVMEAAGIRVDEYGERHGYYIMHEFHHPSLPVLQSRKILRCGISQAYVSRQIGDKVRMFARGFVDPRGEVPYNISVQLTTATTISVTNCVETSYTKKLGWLMMREEDRRNDPEEPQVVPRSECSCNKSKAGLTCRVCSASFCSRCVVQKKIVVDMRDSDVIEHVLPFCFACVLSAKQMSPHEVAVDTVDRPRSFLQSSSASVSQPSSP
ncbi:hypothetical protein Poli38472_012574 [Pythium oligandrum]|uniref:START domain-containing protein n=1 Tax=Pythium oligandrum TaxID=41045 RepID=A0A8K1CE75_PYTOL|nr:hypothetical protein Poli38472_012574 [Pythium oligandrum]|eukprot:TMW61383.1 hypothetical protein Poli38472_012574 [Pythium oligandrum]